MAKKADFSKKILNILAGKQAVNIPELKQQIGPKSGVLAVPEETYAITRSIKNLLEHGICFDLLDLTSTYQ